MDKFPVLNNLKEYTISQGNRYWPKGKNYISSLPVYSINFSTSTEIIPPKMVMVKLPEWAADIGVNNALLVPEISMEKNNSWEKIDWFLASFWYLTGYAEYKLEKKSKPIHSYSFHLKDWDERIWQYAWVNRIFLFLRRWAAKIQARNENSLFGDLPNFKIHLTHDVDAVSKTFPVRIKQSLFHMFNCVKALINRKNNLFFKHFLKSLKFLLSPAKYWCFERIQKLESQYNQKSCFNFYAGKNTFSLKNWFFNPNYNVLSPELSNKIQQLQQNNWKIGLHQGFENWSDPNSMKRDKKKLEKAAEQKISWCRQHWLKFSWEKTWKSQETAGFKMDTTLAFNDRPGLRTGSALCYNPWNFDHEQEMTLQVLPTVFMDSHFYDYFPMDELQRKKIISYWINEIRQVSGEAAIIWHQRVFASDYGWGKGYEHVLQEIQR